MKKKWIQLGITGILAGCIALAGPLGKIKSVKAEELSSPEGPNIHISISPTIGLTYSKGYVGDSEEDLSYEPDFMLGVGVGIGVAPNVDIDTGIYYVRESEEAKETILGTEYKEDDTFQFLEIPIKGKYIFNLGEGTNIKPFIFGGTYIGFKVGTHYELYVNGTKTDSGNFNDEVKSVDYGLLIGGGLEINEKILVELEYKYGIANIAKDGTYKCRSFILSVGYKFDLDEFLKK